MISFEDLLASEISPLDLITHAAALHEAADRFHSPTPQERRYRLIVKLILSLMSYTCMVGVLLVICWQINRWVQQARQLPQSLISGITQRKYL